MSKSPPYIPPVVFTNLDDQSPLRPPQNVHTPPPASPQRNTNKTSAQIHGATKNIQYQYNTAPNESFGPTLKESFLDSATEAQAMDDFVQKMSKELGRDSTLEQDDMPNSFKGDFSDIEDSINAYDTQQTPHQTPPKLSDFPIDDENVSLNGLDEEFQKLFNRHDFHEHHEIEIDFPFTENVHQPLPSPNLHPTAIPAILVSQNSVGAERKDGVRHASAASTGQCDYEISMHRNQSEDSLSQHYFKSMRIGHFPPPARPLEVPTLNNFDNGDAVGMEKRRDIAEDDENKGCVAVDADCDCYSDAQCASFTPSKSPQFRRGKKVEWSAHWITFSRIVTSSLHLHLHRL